VKPINIDKPIKAYMINAFNGKMIEGYVIDRHRINSDEVYFDVGGTGWVIEVKWYNLTIDLSDKEFANKKIKLLSELEENNNKKISEITNSIAKLNRELEYWKMRKMYIKETKEILTKNISSDVKQLDQSSDVNCERTMEEILHKNENNSMDNFGYP
jgi:hypothetical protein